MTSFRGFLSQLEREITQLNDHMPRTKKSLLQLLDEPAPSYSTRHGQTSAVRREELEYLTKIIPPQLQKSIMLPFTILRRTSLGRGAHTIGGSKLEQFTILRILGKVNTPFEAWQQTQLPRCIYSPEVVLLRKRLPTTTVIGFAT